eukprot:4425396-Prymnesium_polylepis.1
MYAIWLRGVISPVAMPRITSTAAWLPAFPPAPTSIVMKKTTTVCFRRSDSYEARMNDEHDWKISSPTSKPTRGFNRVK